eukprot:m.418917 g.418917  ORF g.418917 m.418917 type:complete len:81 (-) comp16836_c1_seq7:335-577(-)
MPPLEVQAGCSEGSAPTSSAADPLTVEHCISSPNSQRSLCPACGERGISDVQPANTDGDGPSGCCGLTFLGSPQHLPTFF